MCTRGHYLATGQNQGYLKHPLGERKHGQEQWSPGLYFSAITVWMGMIALGKVQYWSCSLDLGTTFVAPTTRRNQRKGAVLTSRLCPLSKQGSSGSNTAPEEAICCCEQSPDVQEKQKKTNIERSWNRPVVFEWLWPTMAKKYWVPRKTVFGRRKMKTQKLWSFKILFEPVCANPFAKPGKMGKGEAVYIHMPNPSLGDSDYAKPRLALRPSWPGQGNKIIKKTIYCCTAIP